MAELIEILLKILLLILYILLLPVALIVLTPFFLFWPGKKEPDGRRWPKDIKGRYKKLFKIWTSLAQGIV